MVTYNALAQGSFGGSHYILYSSSSSVTWDVARAFAKTTVFDNASGYLANITSQTENTFVTSLLPADYWNGAWLGASDAATEGQWIWADGPEARQNPNYSNWAFGSYRNLEDHLIINGGNMNPYKGLWDDRNQNTEPLNLLLVEYTKSPNAINTNNVITLTNGEDRYVLRESNPTTVNALGGNDGIQIERGAGHTINAGDGNDDIQPYKNSSNQSFNGINTIDGGPGSDRLVLSFVGDESPNSFVDGSQWKINGQVTVNGKESFKTINVESLIFESSQFTNVLAAGSDETYHGFRGSQGEIGKGGGIHIVYQKKYGDYEVRLDSSYSNLPTLTVRDKSIGYQHNGVMDNLSRATNVKSVVFLDQAFEVAISQGMPTLVPTTKYVSIKDPSLTSPTTTPIAGDALSVNVMSAHKSDGTAPSILNFFGTYSSDKAITSAREGEKVWIVVGASSIANSVITSSNSKLNYSISGISASDILGGSLGGSVEFVSNMISSTGFWGYIQIDIAADNLIEGTETLNLTVGNKSLTLNILDATTTTNSITPITPTLPTIVPEAFQTTNTITVPTGKLAVSSTAANDLITGSTAINAVDTVAYKGSIKDYKVAMGSNGNYIVVDAISTRDGSDVVVNVERLKFSPDPATGANRIALDLDPAQASAKAALLIGAILPGKLALDPSKYQLMGTVIDLFDQGYSLKDLSGALLRLPIWDILTGKANSTTADIATYLVNNVYGVTSQTANLGADLARSLAIQSMNAETPTTQGTYLATLATSTASQSHIDLVGIQSTGLVYLG